MSLPCVKEKERERERKRKREKEKEREREREQMYCSACTQPDDTVYLLYVEW